MEGGWFLVGLVGVVGVFAFSYYRRKRAGQAWSNFAYAHDLEYSPGGWLSRSGLAGEYRGEAVQVRTEKRGTGRNKKTYTVYSVELPSTVPMDLVLYDESLFSKLGKFFGGQDIEVGRPELDDAFIIRGGGVAEIREFLDRDSVAGALLEVYAVSSDLELEHRTLSIDHRGLARTSDQLKDHLEPIVRCAKVLRNSGKANAIGTMDTYDGGEIEEAEEEGQEEYVAEW